MTRLSTAEFRRKMAETIDRARVKGERIVLTSHDRETVAIISIEDLHRLQEIDDFEDLKDAKLARAHAKKHGTISFDEVRKKVSRK